MTLKQTVALQPVIKKIKATNVLVLLFNLDRIESRLYLEYSLGHKIKPIIKKNNNPCYRSS